MEPQFRLFVRTLSSRVPRTWHDVQIRSRRAAVNQGGVQPMQRMAGCFRLIIDGNPSAGAVGREGELAPGQDPRAIISGRMAGPSDRSMPP